jgi:hypothetical protein
MLEAVFGLIGEFLLQIVLEMLAELGLHAIGETARPQPRPFLAALGYLLLGFIVGALSLLIAPDFLIAGSLRLANLVLAPVAAGFAMSALGAWRAHGRATVRLDRFAYGYLFALALAAVRFQFAG